MLPLCLCASVVLLAGCALPPSYAALPVPPTGPGNAAYYEQFNRALTDRAMTEARKSLHAATLHQLRQTHTNNPNWWIPE